MQTCQTFDSFVEEGVKLLASQHMVVVVLVPMETKIYIRIPWQ